MAWRNTGPTCAEGSDTLTAYLLSIAQEAGYTIPDDALAHDAGPEQLHPGPGVRGSVLNTADLAVRKIAAIEALSRYPDKVRIDPNWLGSFSIAPNLWPTTTLLDWIAVHQHVAIFRSARRGSRKPLASSEAG